MDPTVIEIDIFDGQTYMRTKYDLINLFLMPYIMADVHLHSTGLLGFTPVAKYRS